jgi:penicillin G amidase
MAFGLEAASLFGRLALDQLRPRRKLSIEQRLAMLPLDSAPVVRAVAISWDEHQIPFIEAESDHDLAVALGAVHAHLRLAQIELMRRLAQGRVSEIAGRLGVGIDRLVRTFDIARAVPRILETMPTSTRHWLEGFVRGINHVIDHAPKHPREFSLLNMNPAHFGVGDIVTLGRLIAADVNWLVWMRLLQYRSEPDWPLLWQKLLRHDLVSVSSDRNAGTASALTSVVRSGSNSLAVAAAKSESGGALIASDPHLSITLPNSWLLAGVKSPSLNAVGFMIPGMPFIAIGRNPWIAWGGASLHAASSDLVSVPPGTKLEERVEAIGVRGRPDIALRIRQSPWGPVISDLPQFQSSGGVFALRWMGHEASDEFTAMLRVAGARNWDEFRQAFHDYAVPGLEMNFADIRGHIGQVTAVKLPRRTEAEPADIISSHENGWDAAMKSAELPARFDPAQGFLASANARPEARFPIVGFHFSPPNRVRRLNHSLGSRPKLSVNDLMKVQSDVHLAEAVMARDLLVSWLAEIEPQGRTKVLCDEMNRWDGNYDAQSKGALALETLFFHLARELVPAKRYAAYEAGWGTRALLWQDILAAQPNIRRNALSRAAIKAARDFKRGGNWGKRHRLVLAHPLGQLPVLGRRYRFADLPASGTSETLMKTAHGLTNRRHSARYGSVARHISDLSDPDANYFALLGGQDGWLGSRSLIDQLALWRRSEYIQLPLRPESARSKFRHHTLLTPGRRS